MHDSLLMLYVKFQNLVSGDEGQDLVEYALLCALIALAVVSSVDQVASAVTSVFTNVSTSLA